jgi:hypothetical protein
MGNRWAHPTGEAFCILGAIFNLVRSDIIKTSFFADSQWFHLLLFQVTLGFRAIKNPAYTG